MLESYNIAISSTLKSPSPGHIANLIIRWKLLGALLGAFYCKNFQIGSLIAEIEILQFRKPMI